jgi:transmembrane sensor
VRVQAVGTAFDVRRRAGAVEVVVTEGVVKIWSGDADDEPMLVPNGKRVMIDDQSGVAVATLSAAAADQQLAWRQQRIVLDDTTLADAAEEFNRYHDVKLVIDPALADRKMVGWFRTDDLDGFISASATVVGGRVEHRDKIIRILP